MGNLSERYGVQFEAGCEANGSFNFNELILFKDIIIDGNEVIVFHFVGDSEAADAQIVKIFQSALAPS